MAKQTIGEAIAPETLKNIENQVNDGTGKPVSEEKPKRDKGPRYKNPNTVDEALKHYPIHIVKLVNLVKSNSDIRRYTSLGILNYLYQKEIIGTAKGYVSFNWTKFRVVTNGLSTEYRYVEPFFLNCLIASFTSFANAAQKIIANFCSNEFKNDDFVQNEEDINAAVNFAEKADSVAETEEQE